MYGAICSMLLIHVDAVAVGLLHAVVLPVIAEEAIAARELSKNVNNQ